MQTEYPQDSETSHTGNGHLQLVAEAEWLGLESGVITALASAIDHARLVGYPAGSTLYNEGTEIEALYIIRQGMVKLLSYLGDGHARIVRLHNRPSIIGLNGLLGEPHEHTAIAVDEVQVYQLPMIILASLRDDDPNAFSCLTGQWSQYLNAADTWITEFSSGPIRGRVARLIRFLAGFETDTAPGVVTLLTGKEMAEVLGVTPESISRVIADYKRKGILQPLQGAESSECYSCDLRALEKESLG
jgi:CRP-like cAMP-binding protein